MVKCIKYFNIQTWEGENDLVLSPSQLTVLKAPSEVGKSTLTRFFIRFCTSNGDNENYEDIIRDGCDAGAVTLVNDDNTSIMFMMEKNSRIIGLLDKDGNVLETYLESELTEKVFERFGLIVDQKNNILINVLSRDLPLLFIETSPVYNGAVLSRVLIDRDIERVLDNLKIKEDLLQETLKEHSYKREQSMEATSQIKRVNTDNLRFVLSVVDCIIPVSEEADKLDKLVSDYKQELIQCKQIIVPKVSSKELCKLLALITSEQRLEDLIKSIVTCKSTNLRTTSLELIELSKFVTRVEEFSKLAESITPKARELGITSQELQELLRLEQLICSVHTLDLELRKNTVKLNRVSEELIKCKNELGVCPLCGEVFR